MQWRARICDAFRESNLTLDHDVLEELSIHAASAYEAARAEGLSAPEAEEQVCGLIRSWCKEVPGLKRASSHPAIIDPPANELHRMAGLMNDLQYGIRILRREWRFGLLAIMTMALAIGIMTTLFSVVYGVLLKPLPWPEPDRLVRLSPEGKVQLTAGF